MIVHVALPLPITKSFSYFVPSSWTSFIRLYQRVQVPFKHTIQTGFVVGIDEGITEDPKALYEIREIVDICPLIKDSLVSLSEWASRYYITPLGVVLKWAVPLKLPVEKYLIVRTDEASIPGLDGTPLKSAYARFGKEEIFQYYSEGLLEICDSFTGKRFVPSADSRSPAMEAQKLLLIDNVQNRLEYYSTLISEHLVQGLNVLMFLPDYHTAGRYFHRRLAETFPGRVAWYGTTISPAKRMETYFRAQHEEGLLLLANRSGVFLPIKNHSLTIVERHEEDEYRNEEGFKFNAAALAIKRAELEHIPIVLGSASPSVEMFQRAQDGEFHRVDGEWLKTRQCSEIIVERKRSSSLSSPSSSVLPEDLGRIVGEAVEKRENVAIYTPRKDYTSYIRCLDCKELLLCQACQGVLSYRKRTDQLICTGCGKVISYEGQCTRCGSNLLSFSQIGAEYVEEKLRDLFHDANIVRISPEAPHKDLKILSAMLEHPPVTVVGTQSLSKLYGIGIDKLILLGWEGLMTSLGFRAGEKMFQVLANLTDALSPSETYVIMDRRKKLDTACFFDLEAFYLEELNRRKSAEFPPYARIFLIEVEKERESTGEDMVKKIKMITEKAGIIGRVTGPLVQKKKRYRWRIVLKGNEDFLYQPLWDIYNLSGVRVEADPLFI